MRHVDNIETPLAERGSDGNCSSSDTLQPKPIDLQFKRHGGQP